MTSGDPKRIFREAETRFARWGLSHQKRRNRTDTHKVTDTQFHQIAGISAENRRRDVPTMEQKCLPLH